MFLGHSRTRGVFPGSSRFMFVLALLPVWYYGMELIPLSSLLLLLSACSMARGQEETSTSQAERKRGPSRDTPSNWALLTLSREKLFQVLKVHLGMGRILCLRDKEMAIYGLVMYFCKNPGKRPSFK